VHIKPMEAIVTTRNGELRGGKLGGLLSNEKSVTPGGTLN